MSEATKLPWRLAGRQVVDAANKKICLNGFALALSSDPEAFANDRLVVRAVNNFAQLLAACEAVNEWYYRDGSVGGLCDPMDLVDAAIKAAKGVG